MRRIIGPKREDVNMGVEKIAYENLQELQSSPDIIRVIKSKRIRWMQQVACTVQKKIYTSFQWAKLKDRDHLEHTDVDRG